MRTHFFHIKDCPTKGAILDRVKDSQDAELFTRFINVFYQTILLLSRTTGMRLFRLEFQEMMFIYQYHDLGITLEFRKNETGS